MKDGNKIEFIYDCENNAITKGWTLRGFFLVFPASIRNKGTFFTSSGGFRLLSISPDGPGKKMAVRDRGPCTKAPDALWCPSDPVYDDYPVVYYCEEQRVFDEYVTALHRAIEEFNEGQGGEAIPKGWTKAI